jgi:hypothetical protein
MVPSAELAVRFNLSITIETGKAAETKPEPPPEQRESQVETHVENRVGFTVEPRHDTER